MSCVLAFSAAASRVVQHPPVNMATAQILNRLVNDLQVIAMHHPRTLEVLAAVAHHLAVQVR